VTALHSSFYIVYNTVHIHFVREKFIVR